MKFILQSNSIMTAGYYVDSDLKKIYDFLITIDNTELNEYITSSSVYPYNNDLDLYIETLYKLKALYEEEELYEECGILKNKIEQSKILKTNHHGNTRHVGRRKEKNS